MTVRNPFTDDVNHSQTIHWEMIRKNRRYFFRANLETSKFIEWKIRKRLCGFYELHGHFLKGKEKWIELNYPCILVLPRQTWLKALKKFPLFNQLQSKDKLDIGFIKRSQRKVEIFQFDRVQED
jgi:hypothetical protein